MLNISKQSDYGLLFLSYLNNKKDYISLSELIAATKLPKRFLARIAASLSKAGIVESKEGKTGGYKLIKKANQINLYDFLKIFEGKLSFVNCSNHHYHCRWEHICYQKTFLREKLNRAVINELKKWSLEDLL